MNNILEEANRLMKGDRQDSYGDASESFSRIGQLWTPVIEKMWSPDSGEPISGETVALCMILLKVSRLTTDPDKTDSWVDIAAYSALGGGFGNV